MSVEVIFVQSVILVLVLIVKFANWNEMIIYTVRIYYQLISIWCT